jgi:hypothetical protein
MMNDCIRIKGDKTTYYLDNKKVSEKAYRKRYPLPPMEGGVMGYTGGWPMMSDAMAVHPSLIAEAERDAAAKGVPTEFTKDGRPILRDREHRKRFMMSQGFFDRSAGYGDAADGYAEKMGLPQRPKEGPLTSLGY